MKKNILRKEFYMEIKKSLGRFLSIFFIVALGVAFFSGIRSTEPSMRYSGDAYFDAHNLMDIKVITTLGLTKQDINELKKVSGVKEVVPAHSYDAICDKNGNQVAIQVNGLLKELNQLSIKEGRLPESTKECFLDEDFFEDSGYNIGDKITFVNGKEKNTYEIVGVGSSPKYISFQKGNTTIGTGELQGFAYVTMERFTSEIYTEAYITVNGAKEATAFTNEYENKVDNALKNIKKITKKRGEVRLEEIKSEAYEELDPIKLQLEDGVKQIEEGRATLATSEEELILGEATLQTKRNELIAGKAKLKNGEVQLQQGNAELGKQEAIFNAGKASLDEGKIKLDEATAILGEKWAEYETGIAQLEEAKGMVSYLEGMIAEGIATPEQIEQMAMLQGTIAAMEPELTAGREALVAAEEALKPEWESYQAAADQLETGRLALENGRQTLLNSQADLNAARTTISNGEVALQQAEAKLVDGRTKLEEAKQTLIEKELELQTGQKEYNDAVTKVEKIKEPKWYISDRNNLPEYSGYGDNADRMRAIGQVFPVLFFLVAALISLTTMTRMVEEQRTQIGTLKALGFSKGTIAKKYILYALLATLAGSVIGVLIGEKSLPYIIITAYRSLYTHMDSVVVPYDLRYAVMSTVAAVFCTLVATIFACYKELGATAAVLMRPPSPKQGKRVFLERIQFVWKHLNFTWKSTTRNLVRYKKRFFMTTFGIGGCMALLLVGFGLKDAIFEVSSLQYEKIQLYDGMLVLDENAKEEDKESLATYIDKEKNISETADISLNQIKVTKENITKDVYLTVPKVTKDFNKFTVFENRVSGEGYELNESGVILTEKMAKFLSVKKGDTITLKDLEGKDRKVTISSVSENYMGHYVYMTADLYESLTSKTPVYNSIYFHLKNANQKTQDTIGKEALEEKAVLTISYTNNMKEQLGDMLSSLNLVIIVLIISAGMLAFVVLYNLNNINITERKRELATLKVLGFYDKEVAAYVYRENIILTLIGAAVGIILGRILHYFIIVTVETDIAMFGRNINISSIIYSILLTIGFSIFVNVVMYYKLKKINMVASLKSVE